jgi:hypothetical protein
MSDERLVGTVVAPDALYKVTVNGHGKPVLYVNGTGRELKPGQADELSRLLRDAADYNDHYGGARR